MRAVPRTTGWKGYIDLVSVENASRRVIERVFLPQKSAVHRKLLVKGNVAATSSQVRCMHICGEKRFRICELKAFLESEQEKGKDKGVARYSELEWKDWLGQANFYGIDAGVAVPGAIPGPGAAWWSRDKRASVARKR
jgi:hypothetical protein